MTEEKVLKNTKRYFETSEKYGVMTEDLIKFLGNDFVTAPASTGNNLHNAFNGGLISHLLLTAKYAITVNNTLPDNLKVDNNSLIKVCLLFQIGKTRLYKPTNSKWHNDRGIKYEFNEDLISMRVGERSAMYALTNGVKLSEEEFQAIINHDKEDSDKQAKWHSSTIGVILRQANELAILEEKSIILES